ncbi:MAG: trehalose-phosphatase [Candidatus Zixiibacteriota bacterium]|nr:MAG: trehalose-phosphatase [candidate division Zixibacteria bacterium]
MLDFDGTLSPFTPERDRAYPYPGIKEILEKIIGAGNTRLAVISGRQLSDLENLLGLKNLPEMWGCHGAERFSRNEGYTSIRYPESTRNLLSSIIDWAEKNDLSDNLEIKPFGVAFHWRGFPDARQKEIEKEVESAWKHRLDNSDLELRKFDGGIEVGSRNINKKNAVTSILSRYKNDYTAAYLGDDYTDEDAFNALGGKGLKVLVRKNYRPTAADIILSPPEELLNFLNRWLKAAT